ncbi:MAG: ABC transporter permease [Ignisphaera sp.]|nr:ABC transporter permease [Ignisphaera sp.]MDW8085601.1 ABC transporter permease [Ignisphaera sp.]
MGGRLYLRLLFRKGRFLLGFAVFIVILMIGLVGPIIYTKDPTSFDGPTESPPSLEYPLGTDTFGRDLMAQLIHGVRTSLYIGVITALIATSAGSLVGAVAGIKSGVIDEALTSVTNIVLSIPSVLLAILVASYFKVRSIELVAFLLGITSWPWYARAIRAQIKSLRERDFVYLSRMAGYSDLKLVVEDIFPNIASYMLMAFVSYVNTGVVGEAALSILGLGPSRSVSLGIILYWAASREAFRRGQWWWFIPPGVTIVGIISSLYAIATAVDEILNPKLRKE